MRIRGATRSAQVSRSRQNSRPQASKHHDSRLEILGDGRISYEIQGVSTQRQKYFYKNLLFPCPQIRLIYDYIVRKN